MPDDRVPKQVIKTLYVEQGMQQPAVPDIDLGRLDQALAEIGVERLKPPQHHRIDKQVEIAANGRVGHAAQCLADLGRVEQLAVEVSAHAPEVAQGFGRNGHARLRYVSRQEGFQEIGAPQSRHAISGRSKAGWKPPAQPKFLPGTLFRANLGQQQWCEFQIGHPSSKRFRTLIEQFAGCRTEQQEAPRLPGCIDLRPQRRKQLPHHLDLIKDDQTIPILGKEQLRIDEARPIRLLLQIEKKRTRELCGKCSRERGLANLTRAEQDDGRLKGKPFLDSVECDAL